MKKWFVGIIVAISLICCGMAMAERSGTAGENITWTLSDDGVLTISGTGKMKSYPFYYDKSSQGHTSDAPWGKKVKSVIIEKSVTSIGQGAFTGCSSLRSVTIPEGVISIGDGAFRECTSMKSITIPEGVISIGESAFYACYNLTEISLPDSMTSIGSWAFCLCNSLKNITIPNHVTSIGERAFLNCSKLKSISITASVTSIGVAAFSECPNLTLSVADGNPYFTTQDGVLFSADKKELVHFPANKKGDYSIPNSVISIGDCAFMDCTNLTKVMIPDSVTSIGEVAFLGCKKLKSITLSNQLVNIGDESFAYCSALRDIILPDSLKSIGKQAFYNCNSLSSVTISENVINIGEGVFDGCDRLTVHAPANSVAQKRALESGVAFIAVAVASTEAGDPSFDPTSAEKSVVDSVNENQISDHLPFDPAETWEDAKTMDLKIIQIMDDPQYAWHHIVYEMPDMKKATVFYDSASSDFSWAESQAIDYLELPENMWGCFQYDSTGKMTGYYFCNDMETGSSLYCYYDINMNPINLEFYFKQDGMDERQLFNYDYKTKEWSYSNEISTMPFDGEKFVTSVYHPNVLIVGDSPEDHPDGDNPTFTEPDQINDKPTVAENSLNATINTDLKTADDNEIEMSGNEQNQTTTDNTTDNIADNTTDSNTDNTTNNSTDNTTSNKTDGITDNTTDNSVIDETDDATVEDDLETWCVYSYTDTEGLHLPVMQSLSYVPTIELMGNHRARVTLGERIIDGTWEQNEKGQIAVYTDVIHDIYLIPETENQMVLDTSHTSGYLQRMVFRRLDPHTAVGEWLPNVASNGDKEVWTINMDLDRVIFNEDGTAVRYSLNEGKMFNRSTGVWKREGNEILFSLAAKDAAGNDILVPYHFFWMEEGNLFNYSQSDNQGRITYVRSNAANAKEKAEIVDLSEFVDTSWTIIGVDLNGALIPYDVIGVDTTDRIVFHSDGSCSHIIQGKPGITSDVKLDNGEIRFLYKKKGNNNIAALLTQDGYLKVTTKDSQVEYYQMNPNAGGKKKLSATGDSVWDFNISEKNNTVVAYGGDKLTFVAAFNNPEVVNSKKKNNEVIWSVTDSNGGTPEEIRIDKKGTLTISKKLNKMLALKVTAVSVSYGTRASTDLNVYPLISAIEATSEKLELFTGQTADLQVSVIPSEAPADGLEVSSSNAKVVDVQRIDPTRYTISGAKAGKASVTFKAPGGASKKISVTVKEPATRLVLKMKQGQKARPGKTVQLFAELTPKNTTDKTLIWEIAEECRELAEISAKGQLSISKEALPGAVITVYCTANGAPVPIRETLDVLVEK